MCQGRKSRYYLCPLTVWVFHSLNFTLFFFFFETNGKKSNGTRARNICTLSCFHLTLYAVLIFAALNRKKVKAVGPWNTPSFHPFPSDNFKISVSHYFTGSLKNQKKGSISENSACLQTNQFWGRDLAVSECFSSLWGIEIWGLLYQMR